MRRSVAAAVAAPVSVVMLMPSGCASVDDRWLPWFMRSDSGYPSALPTVTGDFGAPPEVEFGEEEPVRERLSGVAIEGGESDNLVRSGDAIVFDLVSYDWTGANQAQELYSSYANGSPEAFGLTPSPEIEDLLDCVGEATVGSRVVCSLPPQGEPLAPEGEMDSGTQILVLDVHEHYLKGSVVEAEQTSDGGGDLPTAPDAGQAAPEISIPDSDPPEDLEVEVLAEGDGPEVEEEQRLVIQYTGVRWEDGEVFDSTWDVGKDGTLAVLPVAEGAVIDGWVEGLVGQNVGSRVMLVIPEDMAYGPEAEAMGQPAGTLVFVVDILGATEPQAEPPQPELPEEEAPEPEEGSGEDAEEEPAEE